MVRLIMLIALFVPALAAQATLNISGDVPDDQEDFFLVSINFGSTPQSIALQLDISATSGTAGLEADLLDLEVVCTSGEAAGTVEDWDAGTGLITLNMTTGTYSGIVEFGITVVTDGTGSSPYSGTLTAPSLSAGDLVLTSTQTLDYGNLEFYARIFDRGARQLREHAAGAATTTREIRVDFGAVPQSVQFWVQGIGFGDGSIEVLEVGTGGATTLLDTLTGTGVWSDEGNLTSSTRSGVVTFRIRMITAAAGVSGYTILMPQSVTVLKTKSGGGGGEDGGCSTSGSGSAWLGLVALLGVLVTGLRVRART